MSYDVCDEVMALAVGPGQGKCEARGGEMALPSAVPERPSALKLLVLFFLRCFLRLACGDGGGSILGLVVLEMLGLEQTESPRPVSAGHTHTSGHVIRKCRDVAEISRSIRKPD